MDLLPHSTRCLDLRFYSDFCLAESAGTGQKSTCCNLLLLFRGRSSTTAGGWVLGGFRIKLPDSLRFVAFLHSCLVQVGEFLDPQVFSVGRVGSRTEVFFWETVEVDGRKEG